MVTEESLQAYASRVFAELPCEVVASRNRNNGKFRLDVTGKSPEKCAVLEVDEHMVNADVESKIRTLRGEIFSDELLEIAAKQLPVGEHPAEETKPPDTEPAPPPPVLASEIAPVTEPDPFPAAEVTKSSK